MKKIDENTLYDVAELFKNFSDSTRIRILYSLFGKELSVTEIAEALNMNQSAISHQLRILKNSKLVKNRREGKTIFYSLDDDHVSFLFEFCQLSMSSFDKLIQTVAFIFAQIDQRIVLSSVVSEYDKTVVAIA